MIGTPRADRYFPMAQAIARAASYSSQHSKKVLCVLRDYQCLGESPRGSASSTGNSPTKGNPLVLCSGESPCGPTEGRDSTHTVLQYRDLDAYAKQVCSEHHAFQMQQKGMVECQKMTTQHWARLPTH